MTAYLPAILAIVLGIVLSFVPKLEDIGRAMYWSGFLVLIWHSGAAVHVR